MKTKFSIAIFTLIMALSGCSRPKNPTFLRMENVQFKSVSVLNGPSVTLVGDAIFNNPNLLGATVTEVDLDLFINGKKVTRIVQDVSVEMQGNSDFTLPLNFEVPLEEVWEEIKPTLGDVFQKKMVEYKLDGNIKVGLGSVELKVPVEFAEEKEIKLI